MRLSGVHRASDDQTIRADRTGLSPLPLPELRLRQRDAWMLDWRLMCNCSRGWHFWVARAGRMCVKGEWFRRFAIA